MTYLSRVALNPARRSARGLLGSRQALHAAVLASFPGRLADRTPDRVLWRLDAGDHETLLYVVSPEEPDFVHLVEQAGWPTRPTWQSRDYRPFLDSLTPGSTWGFRLTANPTQAKSVGPGQRSRRVAHVTVAQQLSWLAGRAAGAGFELPAVPGPDGEERSENGIAIRDRAVDSFRRGGATVTLSHTTFEGRLVVHDVVQMRQTLVSGIGPAKAYGCGLLTLARVG